MQLKNLVFAAAAASSVLAAGPSICDKYTTALLKQNTGANQYTLLTLLVNTAAIGNFTGPGTKNSNLPGSMVAVPGILAPQGKLLKYFDGSLLSTNQGGKAVSMNFLDGGGADPIIADPTSSGKKGSNQYTLLTHLYQFFGALLGCTEYGKSGFPSYAGDPNMASVHQFMALDETEFTYFVEQVGLAAASFGVSKADIMTAAMALNTTFGMRCSPPAAVLPGASKQPQAICIEDSCPIDSMMDCGAYAKVVEPKPAMMSPSSGMMSPTPASTPMTSAAPTTTVAPMTTPVASMTPGAPSTPGAPPPASPPPMTSPGAPMYTGAAVAAAPGALLGLAGLAALAL